MPEGEGDFFLDTNIVLYALGDDSDKREISWNLLDNFPVISTQVISESTHVLARKMKMPRIEIEAKLEDILSLTRTCEVSLNEVRTAWRLGQRYSYSHFDSLILASALAANCQILYSEDFQNGQQIDDRLEIINPFVIGVAP